MDNTVLKKNSITKKNNNEGIKKKRILKKTNVVLGDLKNAILEDCNEWLDQFEEVKEIKKIGKCLSNIFGNKEKD